MDYDGGQELKKYQWDNVHNPESMIGWLQDDEEGASLPCFGIFDDCDEVVEILNIIRGKRIENRNLVILYPKDGDTIKSGLKVSYAGEDFEEINIVYEGDTTGTVVAPLEFKEYSVANGGVVTERGFLYSKDSTRMRVQLLDSPDNLIRQTQRLKSYLYGIESASTSPIDTVFAMQLLVGETVVTEDTVLLITAEPAMPDIRARVNGAVGRKYMMKCVIQYNRPCVANGVNRSPNQTSSFPVSGWEEVDAGELWDIDFGTDAETNRPKIRGGIAYLIIAQDSVVLDTIRFFIKGTNPTVQQVNTFVNQAPYNTLWFFKKIIFHESGTPNNLTAQARQFNVYNANHENLAENWNAFSRCPNFGQPCGWGLMQLDNPRPSAQALWDWKANIEFAYDLMQDKRQAVINNLNNAWLTISTLLPNTTINVIDQNIDGTITYRHQRSTHFAHNIDNHFGDLATAPERSLIEACWIKTYNGLATPDGSRHYYRFEPGNEDQRTPHQWHIYDYATWTDASGRIHYNYYVREIGEQQTPD
jgi:hypothetical protein